MAIRRSSAAVLMAGALVATACGNAGENLAERALEDAGGGDVDIDFDDGEFRVETSEGIFSAGSGELPDGWPGDVPTPSDCDIQSSSAVEKNAERTAFTAILTCDGDIETLADELSAAFVDEGWEIGNESSFSSSDLTSRSFEGTKGEQRTALVAVNETADGTIVTVHTESKTG